MEKQTIYTVKSEATEVVKEEAIFLPNHREGSSVFSSSACAGSQYWLVFLKDGTTKTMLHIDKDTRYCNMYTFITQEEAEEQVKKELDKKRLRIQTEIEQKQKELEALK